MGDKVIVEQHGAVLRIVLNQPEAMNAIGPEMASRFAGIAADAAADAAVRCVVVTGAGPHFMAGGDIRYFSELLGLPAAERDAKLGALVSDVGRAVTSLRTMAKPVIGAVRGAAAGFGFSLMCACDVVIASDTVNCKLAYGQLGASPDGGGSYTLPRLLGVRRAMELALLDERIDAPRALELGLVSRVVADAELDAAALALAARLAAQPTAALGRTKQLFYGSFDNDLAGQIDAELQAFLVAAGSHDFSEAVTAFLGRRKPEFRGS